jgi:hypothetical protein
MYGSLYEVVDVDPPTASSWSHGIGWWEKKGDADVAAGAGGIWKRFGEPCRPDRNGEKPPMTRLGVSRWFWTGGRGVEVAAGVLCCCCCCCCCCCWSFRLEELVGGGVCMEAADLLVKVEEACCWLVSSQPVVSSAEKFLA